MKSIAAVRGHEETPADALTQSTGVPPATQHENEKGATHNTFNMSKNTSTGAEMSPPYDGVLDITIPKNGTPGVTVNAWKTVKTTWREILAWVDNPAPEKFEATGYVLGRFNGSKRHKSTLIDRCGVVLDADSPGADFRLAVAMELAGHPYMLHTTGTSTKDKPKYRVIIPLAAPISPEEYPRVVRALAERIGAHHFDTTTDQAERLMLKPAYSKYGPFDYDAVADGEPLDARELLSALAEPSTELEPLADGEQELAADVTPYSELSAAQQLESDDRVRRTVEGFRQKLEDALSWDDDFRDDKGRGWQKLSADAAFTLAQLAYAPWANLDLADAQLLYQEIVPTDIAKAEGCEDNWTAQSHSAKRKALSTPWQERAAESRDDFAGALPSAESEVTWSPADKQTRNQRRMAHRLAVLARGKLIYVPGVGWHHWTGTHWAEDQQAVIAARMIDVVLRRSHAESFGDKDLEADVRNCQTGSAADGILKIARSLEGMSVAVERLDADPWLLNVANGTLDLHTFKLREHRPGDYITKITHAAYDPHAPGPTWRKFLNTSLPDREVQAFLARYVGQALIGQFMEKKLVMLHGGGDNGKSVWVEVVHFALGNYAMTAQTDMLLAKKHNSAFDGTVELRGKRWVTTSEVEKGRTLAPAMVKRLTGGDSIRARNLNQPNIEFEPSHTLAMLMNDLPHVNDRSSAMWDRLRVVYWDRKIPKNKRDPLLSGRLKVEADAVLAWAVAGLRDYTERGALDEPTAVQVATKAYREDEDLIQRFFDECVEQGPDLDVAPTDLHKAFQKWVMDEGNPTPMGRKDFGQEVRARGHAQGGKNHTWQGIDLKMEGS